MRSSTRSRGSTLGLNGWRGPQVYAPLAGTCGVTQIEPAGVLYAGVEVFEAGDGVSDQLANAAVIPDDPVPVNRVRSSRLPLRCRQ